MAVVADVAASLKRVAVLTRRVPRTQLHGLQARVAEVVERSSQHGLVPRAEKSTALAASEGVLSLEAYVQSIFR